MTANVAGYVLAGGRSLRMGTDKALLMHEGATLLERAARAVSEVCGSCVIVGDPAKYSQMSLTVIGDRFPGCGPLAGIHAALLHTSRDWILVTACDMPMLEASRLRVLTAAAGLHPDADALLPVTGGQVQPLCALYRRSALPAIEEALLGGRFKVLDALRPLNTVELEWSDPELFRNVNTPEEWAACI